MPDDVTLRMLSASLWDLRSLCEQQLRALTDAQRLAHQFQKQTAIHAAMKGLLVSEFNTVLRVTALVRESGEECVGLLRQLPVVETQQNYAFSTGRNPLARDAVGPTF